jgi:hypothetical protein
MRTTLTIDDAIAKALRDLAHESDESFKEVVNETLRAGLRAREGPSFTPYRVRPVSLGGLSPGAKLNSAPALADTIEDQESATKFHLRK